MKKKIQISKYKKNKKKTEKNLLREIEENENNIACKFDENLNKTLELRERKKELE